MTFMCVGKPLGVTVVSWTDAASRPTDDAEIEVVPAVEVVVKFATAKPVPPLIVTLPEMDPTFSWEEVKKTVVSSSASEAFPPAPVKETTTAG